MGTPIVRRHDPHRPDSTVPAMDTVGAMAGLAMAGKIRCLGLSEVNANVWRAQDADPISPVQGTGEAGLAHSGSAAQPGTSDGLRP